MGSVESLIEEHFVPIAGYPMYEVSNYGTVVNVTTGKEIKPHADIKSGHLYLGLYRNGRGKGFSVRRLVAQAFFADYKPWLEIFLKSDNKNDCSVMNVTLQVPGDRPSRRQIRIKETGEIFDTTTAVAYRIGGHAQVIHKILLGMGKTHKGYSFEYVD